MTTSPDRARDISKLGSTYTTYGIERLHTQHSATYELHTATYNWQILDYIWLTYSLHLDHICYLWVSYRLHTLAGISTGTRHLSSLFKLQYSSSWLNHACMKWKEKSFSFETALNCQQILSQPLIVWHRFHAESTEPLPRRHGFRSLFWIVEFYTNETLATKA